MVNWANIVGEQIINVEPIVAEIRVYFNILLLKQNIFLLAPEATCQFTIILTGTTIGQVKFELPFKLDGIDDYGYLHVEAEIIVRRFYWSLRRIKILCLFRVLM